MKRSYDAPLPFTDVSERYDGLMDGPVRTKAGEYVSSMTLVDRALQHEWFGRQLRSQPPRFAFRFNESSPVTEYLGNDADTNGHMYELMFHIASFLRAHPDIKLSDEDRGILMLTAGIHDTDETMHEQIAHSCGSVTGDIKCGDKTEADKQLQASIRWFRDQQLYGDLPQATLDRIEAIIAHKDETILGAIYDAAHEFQTYETTEIARQRIVSGDYADSDRDALNEVAYNVRDNVSLRLAPFAGRFGMVRMLLDQRSDETAA